MGTVRRGAAVAANTHCAGATCKHAFNTEAGPQADVVTVFFEVAVPAVIDGEQEFGRARDIHEAEYNAVLRACKASERRSSDARPVRALRSELLTRGGKLENTSGKKHDAQINEYQSHSHLEILRHNQSAN